MLSTRFGVCHDYAVLYNALAKKAGLDVVYVTGMARIVRRHSWAARLERRLHRGRLAYDRLLLGP